MKKIKPLLYNYHTHTHLCGHAKGEAEEYVLEAIKNGFKVLGFSDHAPLPNIEQKTVRMNMESLTTYIDTVNSLKEKYKDQITIYLGLEIEYDESFLPYYKELYTKYHLDYLILGEHFAFAEGRFKSFYSSNNSYEMLHRYTKEVIKGMESGLFLYLAHPDLIISFFENYDDPIVYEDMQKIIKSAKENDVTLEINMMGAKRKFSSLTLEKEEEYRINSYPFEQFWALLENTGINVIIGVDAHDPVDFAINHRAFGYYLIDKYHLNYHQKVNMNAFKKKIANMLNIK